MAQLAASNGWFSQPPGCHSRVQHATPNDLGLLCTFATCVYIACKVSHRVQFRDQLSSMISCLADRRFPKEQVGLFGWRAGMHGPGPSLRVAYGPLHGFLLVAWGSQLHGDDTLRQGGTVPLVFDVPRLFWLSGPFSLARRFWSSS